MQYIATKVPQRHLAPPNGTLALPTQMQSWLTFIGVGIAQRF